ncbi:cell division protein FtsK [Bifidobacterium aemilianum]|uniref:Cell division protein FtsK n=2 Tax=Bifidobacterium aemilianum TaxID=2493120 RepID=A0A366KAA5_9BIFI|nr:cell division protein FtsK [Bifidobacterium aemilianum]
MLIFMVVSGRGGYGLMLLPGIIGMVLSLWLNLRPRPKGGDRERGSWEQPKSGTTATGASGQPGLDIPAQPYDFAAIKAPCLEDLLALNGRDDPLVWRTILRRWMDPSGLRASFSMTQSGPLALDLDRQGPHALLAGTTGSGKSVLLQSWCLALALANPPERLHFIFLDFKGGSAFNRLEGLPHTVGSVSDLDLQHASRALRALEQELRERELLVAGERVASVAMLREPPADLVIVIDEFYALRSQLPDYADRLVRVASLGRSLGMHLIACTQNPLGQVSADMKANMSMNICLRVRDGMQSKELLSSAVAASISPLMPGAAFCDDGHSLQALRCSPIRNMDTLLEAVAKAQAFRLGPGRAKALFTSPLPREIKDLAPYCEVCPQASSAAIPFALADDGISLFPLSLPIGQGNIAVIGAAARGKSTLLATLATTAAQVPSLSVEVWRQGLPGWQTIGITSAAGSLGSQWQGLADDSPIDAPGTPGGQGTKRSDLPGARQVLLVDDADEFLDPMRQGKIRDRFHRALADPDVTVVFALESSRHLRLPEHCSGRIVFASGERPVDLMNGIPSALLAQSSQDDFRLPGRGFLIHQAQATALQCLLPTEQSGC